MDGRLVTVLGAKTQIETFAMLARRIPTEDAEAVVEWLHTQETLLPILDPTAYMQVAQNIPAHLALASAFLTFRKAIDAIVAAETGGVDKG